jgi:hypothetical protein
MWTMTAGRRLAFAGIALGIVIAGCNVTAPSPTPTASGALGIDWGRATSVERPANYEETVSPSYVGKHPILRIQGQASPVDLTSLAGGGFVAVGYAPPDWLPFAWTSATGDRWAIHPMGSTEFTFPVAVTTAADGTVIAVGRAGREPVAWTTRDGVAWDRHAVPILGGDGVPERMTTVTSGLRGFVAGGSVGPELAERHARFWHSTDGVRWVPSADDETVFADAEVRSITPFDGGFLAVGVVGTVQQPMGSVAWISLDGSVWKRIASPAFEGGIAASVSAAPWGGLVAVGWSIDRRNAVAWTSPDGLAWTRAPDEPSRQHSGGFAWMTDVVAIGDLAIAVGDVQGLQRGTAESWISRDGVTWTVSNSAPVQQGAEFYAIVPNGSGGALAVGAFGAPDSYVPNVWITPGR